MRCASRGAARSSSTSGAPDGRLADHPQTRTADDDSSREAQAFHALTSGLHDYVRKCGFSRVVLGLSGGIDSAVTASLAAAALGPDRVTGVAMPTRFSSAHSVSDAEALAAQPGDPLRGDPD